ncbi:hypothetical protein C0Q70_06714 [Pomacea canaliculata]|uniref:Uncharacterized protein n=1 Tax=Pomacea canaliculata TaxID=400727 RepID=A0A2T7PD09_POMCA|nr:hypothetical protein C0Q70_06714 [Pomacea canaliculata]
MVAGDYGTQANDAEVHSIDKTIYFYGRDRSPGVSYGLLYSRANFLTTNVIMDIKDEWAAADNGNSNLLIDSPKLFALNGQPDFEGPVNKDVYVAMNQVITGRQSRQGTGLCSITVTGVLKLTFGPQRVRAHIQMTLTNNPTGATFHIGDSETNDGFAGDDGTQANDAEVHSIGKTIYFYGRDRSPDISFGLLYSRPNFLTTSVIMDIADEFASADSGNSFLLMNTPKLFALNGQPDLEGPVNKDVYLGMNRVITARQDRQGTGLCSLTVTRKFVYKEEKPWLSPQSQATPTPVKTQIPRESSGTPHTEMSVDLRSGSVQGSVTPANGFQWMVIPPENPCNSACDLRGLLKITFDNSTRRHVQINMTFDTDPSGFTFNIGDSISNDGYGVSYGLLCKRDNFITQQVKVDIMDELAAADNGHDYLLVNSFKMFALNGQADATGPVNYDIYVALNRVVTGRPNRNGVGLCKVSIGWVPV